MIAPHAGSSPSPKRPVQLRTERTLIRLPEREDAAAIAHFHLRNREFFETTSPRRPPAFFTLDYWYPRADRAQAEYRAGTGCQLFLFPDATSHQVIGTVNFFGIIHAEFQAATLGYALDQQYTGRGIMHEALEAAIRFMFSEHNLHRIMANFWSENARSGNLLRKLGFQIEGLAKDYLRVGDRWVDHSMAALINPNWEDRPNRLERRE